MKRDRDLSEFGDMIGCRTDRQDSQGHVYDRDGMELPLAPCAQPSVPLSPREPYAPLSPIANRMLGDSRASRPKDRPAAFGKQRKHRSLRLPISRELNSAEPARDQRLSPSGAACDWPQASG